MLELVHILDMEFKNVLDYYNSFEDKWKDINCYAIYIIGEGAQAYFEYLEICSKNIFYLVDTSNPDYIIGYGSIEDSRTFNYRKEYLNTGNIGYGIRPSERNKGYGSKLLNLLLIECEKMGMHEVCVSCLKENFPSNGVIKNKNGKLEKEFFDEDFGKWGLKYWIKLHPKISDRAKRFVKRLINNNTYN